MTQQNRFYYFQLVAVIVDVAIGVIWKYITENILGPDSFETFLKNEKHKFVHIHETSPCCECGITQLNRNRLISREQLLILYKLDDRKQIRDHKRYAGKTLTQICICKYSARENIDVRVVDITLANYIIQKWGKHELGVDSWIKQITNVRNEIFHLSDIQEISDDKFSRKWKTLEGSIIGIAQVIDVGYAEETKKRIMQTKKLTFIGDYMLKYEIICRDYWKNKCAEFERAQMREFERNAAALHLTMPQLFTRSMEGNCQKTMNKIQTINDMIDKIDLLINIINSPENWEMFGGTALEKEDTKRILIPVFMQLDIPNSWDKTKVYNAIDEMRLNGTSDIDIRVKAISIDDLNIYADIAKKVLCNVERLRFTIKKMMSTILSKAEIDTKKYEKLGVHLQDQRDISGANSYRHLWKHSSRSGGVSDDEYTIVTDSSASQHCSTTEHDGVSDDEYTVDTVSSINQHCSKTEPKDNIPSTETFVQVHTEVLNNLPVSSTLREHINLEKSKNDYLYFNSCIKIGSTLVFTTYVNNRLITCNIGGSDIHHIPLSYKPYYITEVDSKTVAVSCSIDGTILIINITTGSVTSTINTNDGCWGISYNDCNLYVVLDSSMLQVMTLTGEVIRTVFLPTESIRDITVDRDRFVCIDSTSIYYCSLDGNLLWQFQNDKYKDLRGVTTDDEGNVYVIDRRTNSVFVVSDDCIQNRELFTESAGLIYPNGIHFDQKKT